MPTPLRMWTHIGMVTAVLSVASCGRGGEGTASAAMGSTTFGPIEPVRMIVQLDERGLPVVLIDGVQAVHASWVFWGADWKYADAVVRTSPADGEPGSYNLNTKVSDLGLSITGQIQRAGSITYTLELFAADDLPNAIGGGIEFGIDLSAFPGIDPPELLPDNRGWAWPTATGDEIRFESDSPLAKIYFERGDPGRIRCFFVADSVAAGAQTLSFRLSLPDGAATRASDAERYARPDASWLADPLAWDGWPIDVGAGNERPAGLRGRVENSNGRLVFEDGTPARFWGINLQAYALFSGTDEQVQLQADRIAALGFNLVRIHHADSGWVTPNIFGEDGQGGDFNEAMAQRIDRWIAALKARGVYVWLDLHVGRRMGESELTEAQGRSEIVRGGGSIKGFNYVNPDIEAAMGEFARHYLTRENSVTGVRYADEPAVVAVLLTNENDLTRHFGNLLLADKNNPVHHRLMLDAIEPIARSMGFSRDQAMQTWEPGPSMLALSEIERQFFDRQTGVVRGIGYDGLIATTNHWAGMGLNGLTSLTRGGLIDVHSYGEAGELSRDPRVGATWLSRIAQARVLGLPLSVTEWNIPHPARDRFTTPLHMAAMASFQGWDAPMLYGYLQEPLQPPKRAREWSAWVDPALMAVMPAASVMFRDGHVAGAQETVVFEPEADWVYNADLTADTTPVLRGVFETHGFAVKLPDTPQLDFDGDAIDAPHPDLDTLQVVRDRDFTLIEDGAHAVTSDTGEIRRDWQRGVVEIRTPKSQAAMGWIGGDQAGESSEAIGLGDVTLRIQTPAAAVCVTSLDNKPIRESGRLLVTAVAQAVPGGEGNQPNSVWIAEPVVGTVEIDVGGRGASVRAIDGRGLAVSIKRIEPDERGVISIPLDGSGLWWIVETE
ncbi:MAG: hypothetical protein ACI89L_002384 [Phycisphaerales bacterium]|jgi:hypothetical protein